MCEPKLRENGRVMSKLSGFYNGFNFFSFSPTSRIVHQDDFRQGFHLLIIFDLRGESMQAVYDGTDSGRTMTLTTGCRHNRQVPLLKQSISRCCKSLGFKSSLRISYCRNSCKCCWVGCLQELWSVSHLALV